MKNNSLNKIEALLFDLGGVIIEIDFDRAFLSWANDTGTDSPEDIKSNFSFDSHYEAHERGEIDSLEYFNSLRNMLGINITDHQFEVGWNSIYKGEIQGIYELLDKARKRLPVYAFTNSNFAHQKVWSEKYYNILSLFQKVFVSSEIGKRKPEPDAYYTVSDSMSVEPNRILFFE